MLTYDEIDELITLYQENKDRESLEKLIAAFDAYLTKWVNVVKCEYINTLDREVAHFVSLFKFSSLPHMMDVFRSYFDSMPFTEVYHEMVLLFIYTILKYEKDAPFHSYMGRVFRFRVFRWVTKRIDRHVVYNEALYEEELRRQSAALPGVPDDIILTDPSLFPCLNAREKQILYLRYLCDMSTGDIADIQGCTRATINRIISKAKIKLLDWLNKDTGS